MTQTPPGRDLGETGICRAVFSFEAPEPPAAAFELFFRPFGADSFPMLTHGLRRGLHSFAASRVVVARVKSAAISQVPAPGSGYSGFVITPQAMRSPELPAGSVF